MGDEAPGEMSLREVLTAVVDTAAVAARSRNLAQAAETWALAQLAERVDALDALDDVGAPGGRRSRWDLRGTSVVAELAAARRWSHGQAHRRLRAARDLLARERLWARVQAGDLDHQRTTLCLEAVHRVALKVDLATTAALHDERGPDAAAEAGRLAGQAAADLLETRCAESAPDLTVPQLRARLRLWEAEIAPEVLAADDAAAYAERRVALEVHGDGSATLLVIGPEAEVAALYARLDLQARHERTQPTPDQPTPDQPTPEDRSAPARPTLDQRRFDLAVRLRDGHDEGTQPVEAVVVFPAEALAGDGTRAACGGTLRMPVNAWDGEPVPLATSWLVRALAADSPWKVRLRRAYADPLTGQPVHVEDRTYAIPTGQRRKAHLRTPVCSAPGCLTAARACEDDHVLPYAQHGASCACNTTPLCKRHHLLKTHTDWTPALDAHLGTTTWRTPTGRTRTDHPVPLVPPRQQDPPPQQDPPEPVPF